MDLHLCVVQGHEDSLAVLEPEVGEALFPEVVRVDPALVILEEQGLDLVQVQDLVQVGPLQTFVLAGRVQQHCEQHQPVLLADRVFVGGQATQATVEIREADLAVLVEVKYLEHVELLFVDEYAQGLLEGAEPLLQVLELEGDCAVLELESLVVLLLVLVLLADDVAVEPEVHIPH
jgi:hypothetical protein